MSKPYRLIASGGVLRVEDNATIPSDPLNRDWRRYQAWVAGGNEPDAAGAIPVAASDVDRERDRRIALGATVDIGGISIPVQTRDERDFRNINGLVSRALVAKMTAPASDVVIQFRAADNTVYNMAPDHLLSLGEQVAAHVQAIYAAAWAIKALGQIPSDYADDARWP